MRWLSLIAAFALASCAIGPRPNHFTQPSTKPVEESVTHAQTHIGDAQKDVATLAKRVGEKDAVIVALSRHLFDAQTELQTAQGEIVKLDAAVKTQTDAANTALDRANKAVAETAKVKAAKAKDDVKYHRLKFGICSLAAFAALLLLMRYSGLIALAGPYGAIAYAAVPIGLFGALWLVL